MPTTRRAMFFAAHLLKCKDCREEFQESKASLPESRHNKLREDIIRANHHSVII